MSLIGARIRFLKEGVLKEHRAGLAVAELRRKHGISGATFYTWRSKYGGMVPKVFRYVGALTMLMFEPGCGRWPPSDGGSATDACTSCSSGRALC
jgi:hypothetical protein